MKIAGVLVLLLALVVPKHVISMKFRPRRQAIGNDALPSTLPDGKPAAFPGPLPFALQECKDQPQIPHAEVSCDYSGCRALCDEDYKLASGLGSGATLHCDHSSGQLTLDGKPWQAANVSCLPFCGVDDCLHGGKCVAPRTCECPAGYTGKHCETRPENAPPPLPQPEPQRDPNTCAEPDFPVLNAEVTRSGQQLLVVRCKEGFEFKIGGRVAFIQCRGGDWDHPQGIFSPGGALVCEEMQCNPPCLNGGKCLLPEGVCDCPYKYWGSACQNLRCTLPDNSALTSASLGGLHWRMKIQCHPNHKMMNNRKTQTILCRNGDWVLPGRGFLKDNDVKCYAVNQTSPQQ